MNSNPKLIVMLTYNDHTVKNAYSVFDKCKNSKADFWGFKEEGLPPKQMMELYAHMKDCGKTTALEVVAYTEKECIKGARLAVDCGCNLLMGTTYFDSVNEICKENNLKYMPFVGKVFERPSVLSGDVDEMIAQAEEYLEKGVFGFDLLGYRYTGDPVMLNRRFVSQVNAPVCLAGSVNSLKRLDEIKDASPWAFTIGTAFFENQFGDNFREQIDAVCDYINR